MLKERRLNVSSAYRKHLVYCKFLVDLLLRHLHFSQIPEVNIRSIRRTDIRM